jgi:polyisoprenoid-binding protein YceI
MNKEYSIVILLLFLVNAAIAQTNYTVTKAAITFQIKNMGINTSGGIGGVQAAIQFDPANPGSSSIEATANAATINTDNDMRDGHLKGDEFFNTASYPKITMKSVSFKHKSGDKYTGQFNVTIKNKTLPVEVPFTYDATPSGAIFKGSFKLKRTDFGVGTSSMVLSDDVTVFLNVETSK